MYVNGYNVNDPYEVLETLRLEMHRRGKPYLFAHLKKKEDSISFTCPFHKGGRERKASAGLLLREKGGLGEGFVHCFTCNYTADLFVMISNVMGVRDAGVHGLNWYKKTFNINSDGRLDWSWRERDRSYVSITDALKKMNETFKQPLITLEEADDKYRRLYIDNYGEREYHAEEELAKYRVKHEYMYKRGLTPEILNMFDVGFDANFKDHLGNGNPSLTFPLRDENGVYCIIRRSVNRKLFNIPSGIKKPIWGLYEVPFDADSVIICESIINALTLWQWGYYAVALIGLGTSEQVKMINWRKWKSIYLCFDGDPAGRRATARWIKALPMRNVYFYDMIEGKDVNDLSREEFEALQVYQPSLINWEDLWRNRRKLI